MHSSYAAELATEHPKLLFVCHGTMHLEIRFMVSFKELDKLWLDMTDYVYSRETAWDIVQEKFYYDAIDRL